MTGVNETEGWKQCDGQENAKCAKLCYASRYGTGVYASNKANNEQEQAKDQAYWTEWVGEGMDARRAACDAIDTFIAPSKYIFDKLIQFGLPAEKVFELNSNPNSMPNYTLLLSLSA